MLLIPRSGTGRYRDFQRHVRLSLWHRLLYFLLTSVSNVNAGHSLVCILISRFVLNLREDGGSQETSPVSLCVSQTDIRFASGEGSTNAGRLPGDTEGTICSENDHGSMQDDQGMRNVWFPCTAPFEGERAHLKFLLLDSGDARLIGRYVTSRVAFCHTSCTCKRSFVAQALTPVACASPIDDRYVVMCR